MILTKNEVASQLKMFNKNYINDEYFRNAFATTSLAEQTALSNLEYDYSSAINNAYISAMNNSNSIQNSALGTGYKEQALAQNQSALLDAFEQYKQNYVSGQQSVQSQYDEINQSIYDLYANQEAKFASQAETFIDYWDEHYNYLNYLWEDGKYDLFNNADLHNFVTNDEYGNPRLKTKGELFAMGTEGALVDTNGELTDAGRHYLDVVENMYFEGTPSFGDYLVENNRKLWDWASEISSEYGASGVGLFKELTGRNTKDYSFDLSPYDYHIADVADTWATDYVTLTKDNLITEDYFDDDAEALLTGNNWKLSADAKDTFSVDEFEDSAGTLTKGQAGSSKNSSKTIKSAVEAARNGTLKNGTIIDINVGGGAELWAYWNGKFVKMQEEPATAEEIAAANDKAVNKYFENLGYKDMVSKIQGEGYTGTKQGQFNTNTRSYDTLYYVGGEQVRKEVYDMYKLRFAKYYNK